MTVVSRTVAGAALGHVVGAVVGVVVLAGPASRLSTATVLVLVHVVADTGTGLGALRAAGAPARGWPAVAGVVGAGAVASTVVLGLADPAPVWLLVRAAVVVGLAGFLGWSPVSGAPVVPTADRAPRIWDRTQDSSPSVGADRVEVDQGVAGIADAGDHLGQRVGVEGGPVVRVGADVHEDDGAGA